METLKMIMMILGVVIPFTIMWITMMYYMINEKTYDWLVTLLLEICRTCKWQTSHGRYNHSCIETHIL